MADEPEIRLGKIDDAPLRSGALPTIRPLASVVHQIRHHVGQDLDNERGGILLGWSDTVTNTVWITAHIPALAAQGTRDSLTFTHETWTMVDDERERLHPDLKIVGWYHSHPNFGIFLSAHDRFIHQNFFTAPWHIAYVVDPIRKKDGYFGWEHGEITETPRPPLEATAPAPPSAPLPTLDPRISTYVPAPVPQATPTIPVAIAPTVRAPIVPAPVERPESAAAPQSGSTTPFPPWADKSRGSRLPWLGIAGLGLSGLLIVGGGALAWTGRGGATGTDTAGAPKTVPTTVTAIVIAKQTAPSDPMQSTAAQTLIPAPPVGSITPTDATSPAAPAATTVLTSTVPGWTVDRRAGHSIVSDGTADGDAASAGVDVQFEVSFADRAGRIVVRNSDNHYRLDVSGDGCGVACEGFIGVAGDSRWHLTPDALAHCDDSASASRPDTFRAIATVPKRGVLGASDDGLHRSGGLDGLIRTTATSPLAQLHPDCRDPQLAVGAGCATVVGPLAPVLVRATDSVPTFVDAGGSVRCIAPGGWTWNSGVLAIAANENVVLMVTSTGDPVALVIWASETKSCTITVAA